MSATNRRRALRGEAGGAEGSAEDTGLARRAADPRVVRSRAAALEAGRTLFLRHGYAGTTMEDIATLAGLTKRTLYNNFVDKDALFTQIVVDVIGLADEFVAALHEEFAVAAAAPNVSSALGDIGRRLALAVVRPEVVALRRLLVGEARSFPALAREYYDRAPGQVIEALAAGFRLLDRAGLLDVADPRRAAAQFAYLVSGENLDRAILAGVVPASDEIVAHADEGVATFMARYGVARLKDA